MSTMHMTMEYNDHAIVIDRLFYTQTSLPKQADISRDDRTRAGGRLSLASLLDSYLRAIIHTRIPFSDFLAAQPSTSGCANTCDHVTHKPPTPYCVAGGLMPNSCRWRLTAMGAIAGRPAPPQVRARWGLRVPSLVWCLGRLALAFLCR